MTTTDTSTPLTPSPAFREQQLQRFWRGTGYLEDDGRPPQPHGISRAFFNWCNTHGLNYRDLSVRARWHNMNRAEQARWERQAA